jgi:hypothetical protein
MQELAGSKVNRANYFGEVSLPLERRRSDWKRYEPGLRVNTDACPAPDMSGRYWLKEGLADTKQASKRSG